MPAVAQIGSGVEPAVADAARGHDERRRGCGDPHADQAGETARRLTGSRIGDGRRLGHREHCAHDEAGPARQRAARSVHDTTTNYGWRLWLHNATASHLWWL